MSTRTVVSAAALVAVVAAGGVTAEAAYGARGAGGDAAQVVTPAGSLRLVGETRRGVPPGVSGLAAHAAVPAATAPTRPAAPVPSLIAPKLRATLKAGARGTLVYVVQWRLAWTGLKVKATGVLDAQTVKALRKFQGKQALRSTGTVNARTYARLVSVTRRGPALDPRCYGAAEVLCVDKSQKVLRYLVDGKVRTVVDVRFGSPNLPTREGVFSVYYKSRYHVSTLFHTPMPLALFFSGGQAVHYSKYFAAVGYAGHSHGCVNVRDYRTMSALFDEVPVGTKVVVYRTDPRYG